MGVELKQGRYRLRERADTAAFGHSAGPQSWKSVLHPARARPASGTVLGWSWLHPPYRWHFGAVARVATTAIEFDAPSVTLSGTPHDRIADAFLGDCRFNMGPGRHVRFPVGLIPGTKD